MNSLKLTLLGIVASLSLTLAPAVVFADATPPPATPPAATASTPQADACDALTQIDSSKDCSSGDSGLKGLIASIVNILSWVVGIIGVIMVIISGLKYVTSNGDASGISSAKNTLIYALVGLVIAALAQFLVHFALSVGNKG